MDTSRRYRTRAATPQMVMLAAMINLALAASLAATLVFAFAVRAEARDPATDAPIRIIAFGDSLTAGFGLKPGQAFPDVLQMALRSRGHNVEVINAGVSGDTTAAGLARFDWAIGEDADAVIVELGANDMLRGQPPAETRANLDKILSRLDARGLPVLLAGMQASLNWGADYRDRFNPIFPDLANKHGAILYPFFLDGIATDPKFNLADGLHPNPKGVATIVGRILPKVEELIERVKTSKAAGREKHVTK